MNENLKEKKKEEKAACFSHQQQNLGYIKEKTPKDSGLLLINEE